MTIPPTTLHILLIEDNEGDARIIRELLRDADDIDFDYVLAETLHDAIDAVQTRSFDIVLLDLSLPDSTGIDTLLRMREAAPKTALVVLTGYDDQRIGVQAVSFGAQDYLIKGETDAKLLAKAIRYAVQRQRTEDALRRSEEEYRSLITDVFNTSMVSVLILDQHFRVVWLNEATEIYFGVKRGDVIGRDGGRVIDDTLKCVFADPDDFSVRVLKAYADGAFTDRFECHVTPGDGREERWLEHWSQPIHAGMYAGGRIEQYTDITDRKRFAFAERQAREFAEALRDTNAILVATLNFEEVIRHIFSNIYRIMPHDYANIMLRADGSLYSVGYEEGAHGQQTNLLRTSVINPIVVDDTPVFERMKRSRSFTMLDDVRDEIEYGDFPAELVTLHALHGSVIDDVRGYVGVPILLQDEAIGFINLFSYRANYFSPDDAQRLTAFAEHAAIAIQNARLYGESQELAAIEERTRLARELHDSVSQTLFTSSAMSEGALRQWSSNPTRSRELLDTAHQLTVSALAEMRVLLLELRPASLTKVEFKYLINQYVESFRSRSPFTITAQVDDVPPLPPDVQIGLYRIVQEAFNNISKHANASEVALTVRHLPPNLEVAIDDNGLGFLQNEVEPSSLGLSIMNERATEIGARITITSAVNAGTHIKVNWTKMS